VTATPPSPGLPPGVSLEPPLDWTPDQAVVVYDFVDNLRDLLDDLLGRIWGLYGADIQDQIQRQRQPAGNQADQSQP